MRMVSAVALTVVALAAAALPALAQQDTARQDGALAGIAARLSARYHVPVLVDPAIVLPPRTTPTEPAADLSLDRAFDALTAPLRGVAWRLVSMRGGADPPALAASVRALDRMAQTGLAVEDTAARRADIALRDRPDTADFGSLVWQGAYDHPVVLLYSATASSDGRGAAERLADLQRRQAELMDRLPPDQRANPMLQTVQLLQRLDPATMQSLLQPMMEAGGAAWDSTPPDQRQQMIGAAMQVMQTFGAPPAPGSGSGRQPARPAPPRDYARELKGIAAALGRKFNATVLVDPMLFVETAAKMPADAASVEVALDALLKPLHGAVWRRVYVTRPQTATALTAESLAGSARALAAARPDDLVVGQPASKRVAARGRRRDSDKTLPADLRAGGFDPKPLYLVYAPDAPDASALSPMERYADLQRQQLEMMLSMNAADLSQSMQQAIGLYQSTDPATRGQLMGLPVMAAMMAVWFPRAAKQP